MDGPSRDHAGRITLVLAFGLLLLAVISLLRGEAAVDVGAALRDALHGGRSVGAVILFRLRLPRLLLGMIVGGTLGLSGAALQGYLRNPLADPGILGVSGGAALGAVCVFYTALSGVFAGMLPLGGLVGALVAGALLMGLVGRGGPAVLVLAGVALSSLTAALTALVLDLVPSPFAGYEIMRWLMGSLTDRTMTDVLLAFPGVVMGTFLMAGTGRALDALMLGEDVAASLGFPLSGRGAFRFGTQTRVVLGAALAVGSSVAVSGAIGFVGLVVPHLLRPLVGYRPSRLLLPSALGGAVLVVAADLAVRALPMRSELPLGVATALIGAPVFLRLALRARTEETLR